ncbi:hypothetical protein G6F56_013403 [Rhizopus delemar]|nr:hypothetical protein G6F56_013403 [Rhizopus delemar]
MDFTEITVTAIVSLITGYVLGRIFSNKTLVVRSDLGMTKGKMAAQCGHATLACYKAAKKDHPEVLKAWEHCGQAKVALKCDGEEKL